MKITLVIALLFALVATAGAAPLYYNYKPGEFLVINGGESPIKGSPLFLARMTQASSGSI